MHARTHARTRTYASRIPRLCRQRGDDGDGGGDEEGRTERGSGILRALLCHPAAVSDEERARQTWNTAIVTTTTKTTTTTVGTVGAGRLPPPPPPLLLLRFRCFEENPRVMSPLEAFDPAGAAGNREPVTCRMSSDNSSASGCSSGANATTRAAADSTNSDCIGGVGSVSLVVAAAVANLPPAGSIAPLCQLPLAPYLRGMTRPAAISRKRVRRMCGCVRADHVVPRHPRMQSRAGVHW